MHTHKQQVLNHLLTIPKGETTTYKAIADTFDIHPRTVAAILKSNTQQDTYPCYKVIKSDGSLGGYNLGIDEKKRRLQADGIEISDT